MLGGVSRRGVDVRVQEWSREPPPPRQAWVLIAPTIGDSRIESETMRRLGFTLVALIAVSTTGYAENRAFASALSCRAIANTVARNGAVVLITDGDKFDRYVSDQSHCAFGEVITPAWVRSVDNSSCFIGYTCEQHHE